MSFTLKQSISLAWLLFSLSFLTFAEDDNEIDPRQSLDWIPIQKLTDEQRLKVSVGCCGAYVAPERTDRDATLSADNAPIKITAGSITVKKVESGSTGNYTELTDKVDIIQGNRRIEADKAIINETDNFIDLKGGITIRESDLLLTGDTAIINRNDDTVTIDNAQYVIYPANARGSAKNMEKLNNNQVILTEGSYTQCPPEDNSWLLRSSKITIDNEKQQGYAKGVQLLIKDVPVFYSPYLQFPVGDQRQSGFLAPSISSSESNGINLAIPFYLNLAPNYDAILTPFFLNDHGLLLKTDTRYLNQYFYTETTVAYLDNDQSGFDEEERRLIKNGELTKAEIKSFKGKRRWLFDVQQQGGIGNAWYSTIDYARVSDKDYFRDLDETSRYASNESYLNQHITAGYNFQHWLIGIETIKFQSLIDEETNNIVQPYQQLPLLRASGNYDWNKWSAELEHEWARFDNEDDNVITGDRTRIDYGLLWNNTWQGGFFKPALQLKHLRYVLNDDHAVDHMDKTPSISVPQAIIDTGLFFERDDDWFDLPYRQTFEPRLYYLRSQFKDQTALDAIDFDTNDLTFSYDQLFRDTRFSGSDRIDDANQLSVGLTTRFINSRSGREWFSLNLGRIFYFDNRRVTLNNTPDTASNSDIASRINSALNDHWGLTSDIVYNPGNDKINLGNLGLKYRDDNHLFNLDYRYVRGESQEDRIEQLNTSLIVPFYSDNRWYFIGQNGYDITNDRKLRTLAGIEYNDCCYRIRFAWQRSLNNGLVDIIDSEDLTYDRRWFIEIQFRGLGGTGKQLDNLFDDHIDGYTGWQAKRQ